MTESKKSEQKKAPTVYKKFQEEDVKLKKDNKDSELE